MTGWTVDVVGVDALMAEMDTHAGELRTSVADCEDGIAGALAALSGPVTAAFSSFTSTRRDAPGEVVTMVDNAVGAAVMSAAALAAGNEEMAEELRVARVHATGEWSYQGAGGLVAQPW